MLFRIQIEGGEKELSFGVDIAEKQYIISLPIYIFGYGFSSSQLCYKRDDYLWYSDVGEQLYVYIPGAEEVYAYWMRKLEPSYFGDELGEGLFRIDLSEIKRKVIEAYKMKWQYINLGYLLNGKKRTIPLPAVLRTLIVDPFFKLYYDKVVYMDINIMGKADLYVSIANYREKSLLVVRRKINSGRNEFPELSFNGFYDIYPTMEENDEFGFESLDTKMKEMRGMGCLDTDNMVNCRFQIKDIIYDEELLSFEYTYLIETKTKVEKDVYEGTIFRVQKSPDGKMIWDTKKPFGWVRMKLYQNDEEVKFTLEIYSKKEEDWLPLYYDRARNYLLGCDNNLIDTLKDYNRFVPLEEDTTEYIVDTSKLRRVR